MNLIFTQIAQHHMMIFHNLAKLMGWQVLASSTNVGVGDMESCGNAASMMAASPTGNRSECILQQKLFSFSLYFTGDSTFCTLGKNVKLFKPSLVK